MSAEEFHDFIAWLKRIATSFAVMSHSHNCKEPLECPSDHGRCKRRLGLHTAIMWSIAIYIFNLLATDNIIRLSHLDKIRNLVGFAESVFYLHKRKYLGYLSFVSFWGREISKKYYELHKKFEENQTL